MVSTLSAICRKTEIFLVISTIESTTALIGCNKSITKLQLCSEKPHNPDFPDDLGIQKPMDLKMTLNLISMAEFNDDESTILVNIILGLFWNDTRITLEYPNK